MSPTFSSSMSFLSLSSTPGTSVRNSRRLACERAGDGAGECVGVDIVARAVGALRDGREHGDQLAAEHLVEHGRVDLVGFADEAEIDAVRPLDLLRR